MGFLSKGAHYSLSVENGDSVPQRLTLEFTNRCRRKCAMCPRQYMRDEIGDIDPQDFRKLCDEGKEMGIQTLICHWRGESSLHPCFGDLVRYARDKFPRLEIATGGGDWTAARQRVLSMFDFISVSLHDENAARLVEMVLEHKSPRAHVQVTCVRGEPTEDLAKSYAGKVNRVKIYEPHTVGGVWGRLETPRQTAPNGYICERLRRDMVVGWDGRVSRCTHVWATEPMNAIGMGLRAVWGSMTWQARRLRYWADDVCLNCDEKGAESHGRIIRCDAE